MKHPELCELCLMDNGNRLYNLARILSMRGIHTAVLDPPRDRRSRATRHTSRLMVPCRELVYARWVAHAAGVDLWPVE